MLQDDCHVLRDDSCPVRFAAVVYVKGFAVLRRKVCLLFCGVRSAAELQTLCKNSLSRLPYMYNMMVDVFTG